MPTNSRKTLISSRMPNLPDVQRGKEGHERVGELLDRDDPGGHRGCGDHEARDGGIDSRVHENAVEVPPAVLAIDDPPEEQGVEDANDPRLGCRRDPGDDRAQQEHGQQQGEKCLAEGFPEVRKRCALRPLGPALSAREGVDHRHLKAADEQPRDEAREKQGADRRAHRHAVEHHRDARRN